MTMINNDMVYAIKVQMDQAIKDIDRLKGAFTSLQTQASKKVKGGGLDPSLVAFQKEQVDIQKQMRDLLKMQTETKTEDKEIKDEEK